MLIINLNSFTVYHRLYHRKVTLASHMNYFSPKLRWGSEALQYIQIFNFHFWLLFPKKIICCYLN